MRSQRSMWRSQALKQMNPVNILQILKLFGDHLEQLTRDLCCAPTETLFEFFLKSLFVSFSGVEPLILCFFQSPGMRTAPGIISMTRHARRYAVNTKHMRLQQPPPWILEEGEELIRKYTTVLHCN